MISYNLEMTTTEIKPITVQMIDLFDGETITDASVTHTSPGGSALVITPDVDSPYVNFEMGPFGVAGQHFVKVHGEGSLGSGPEVLYAIVVKDV